MPRTVKVKTKEGSEIFIFRSRKPTKEVVDKYYPDNQGFIVLRY